MSEENTISFNKPQIFIDFGVHDHDDNTLTVWLPISCNEDIESYMRLYFAEKWNELFGDKVEDVIDISYVELDGIRLLADEKHKIEAGVLNSNIYAQVKIDLKQMSDDNALKLQNIRKILE